MADPTPHGFESRVARLETSVELLHTELSNVGRSIKELSAQWAAGRGVNWSAMGVVVTIVALAGTLIGYAVNDAKGDLEAHVKLDGHAPALIMHAETRQQLQTLAERVTSNDETDARLEAGLAQHRDWMDHNGDIDATQSEKIAELEREHWRERARLDIVRETRWSKEDGLENRDRVAALEVVVAEIKARLETK